MPHHPYRNYRIISVLFWSFPYCSGKRSVTGVDFLSA